MGSLSNLPYVCAQSTAHNCRDTAGSHVWVYGALYACNTYMKHRHCLYCIVLAYGYLICLLSSNIEIFCVFAFASTSAPSPVRYCYVMIFYVLVLFVEGMCVCVCVWLWCRSLCNHIFCCARDRRLICSTIMPHRRMAMVVSLFLINVILLNWPRHYPTPTVMFSRFALNYVIFGLCVLCTRVLA